MILLDFLRGRQWLTNVWFIQFNKLDLWEFKNVFVSCYITLCNREVWFSSLRLFHISSCTTTTITTYFTFKLKTYLKLYLTKSNHCFSVIIECVCVKHMSYSLSHLLSYIYLTTSKCPSLASATHKFNKPYLWINSHFYSLLGGITNTNLTN